MIWRVADELPSRGRLHGLLSPHLEDSAVLKDKKRILLIEDNPQDQSIVTSALEYEGYEVLVATTGEDGLSILEREQPNLIILDLILPGIDGLEVCRQIRAHYDLPVIMLTAKDDELDMVVGLEVGADDYITKPFSVREFVARVRALLRRAVTSERTAAHEQHLSFPGLEIDLPAHSVEVNGEQVHLTPKEFDLLYFLASEAGTVFTRQEIIRKVWGYESASGDLRTVDTHIKRLRTKLEESFEVPWRIGTVWGVGYRFQLSQWPPHE